MNNFGQLSVVDGDLWFSNHVYQEYLESVYPLKKVVGNLNLKKPEPSRSLSKFRIQLIKAGSTRK